jgi:IS30 family transposase
MSYQRLIESKLRQQWSPEQIADWLGQTQRVSFSHERIYPYLRADQQAGGFWHKQLRRRLGLRRARRSTLYKGKITQRVSIDQRPAIVDDKSRFTCIAQLPFKQSEVVADALIEILRPYK